ncbi:CHAT domain-containing protein [Rhodoflexus caldus]|uniref:CHAT domain-containing protein n=1 Tax=Rhodoflexus caldus TaxID=2891236 RepID=UPI00202A6E0F|nr:CHAT domain-containing protein [Rhodoflexus caldus]
MYVYLRYCLAAFLFGASCCAMLFAQSAEKTYATLAVCEQYYDDGDYEKALEKCEKLIRNLKQGSYGQAVAYSLPYLAKYQEAMGQYLNFERSIQEMLNLRLINSDKSRSYGLGLLHAATAYAEYSYANRAEEYLGKAQALLANEKSPLIRAEMLHTGIRIAVLRQDFAAFQQQIGNALKAQEAVLVNEETYFDEIERAEKTRVVSAIELRRRKNQYAELLNTWGDMLRQAGRYGDAGNKLSEAENWIRSNLSTRDAAMITNKHFQNLLNLDMGGNNKESLQKQLDRHIFTAEKRFTPVHKTYLAIHETLIDNYIESKFIRRSSKQRWELRQNTLKYYGRNKMPYAISQRLDARTAYKFQNYREAQELLNDALKLPEKVPVEHQEYRKLTQQAYELALATDNLGKAETYLQAQVASAEKALGKNSLPYHYARMKLANYYAAFTNRFSTTDSIIRESYHGFISKKIAPEHKDRVDFLNDIATYYQMTGRYDSALVQLNQAVAIAKKRFGENNVSYAVELQKLVKVQMQQGRFADADKNITHILDIFKKAYNRTLNLEYSQALETAASYYATMGLFNDARAALLRADRLFQRSNSSIASSTAIDDLAGLYIAMERFTQTERLLNDAIEVRRTRYGENSRFLINPYNQLARLYLATGDYVKADDFAAKAFKLASETFGDSSAITSEIAETQVLIYTAIGDYEKAIAEILRVRQIKERNFGRNNIAVANLLRQEALIRYFSKEPPQTVERLFNESRQIIARNLGSRNPIYADALKDLALIYTEGNQPTQALQLLDSANRIWNSILKTGNNTNAAEIAVLKGNVYTRAGNFGNADKQYKSAMRILAKILSTKHPLYVQTQAQHARMFFAQKNYAQAQKIMEGVLAGYRQYITTFFPVLSDREKTKYWGLVRADYEFYNNLLVRRLPDNPALAGALYDNATFAKSLLVSNAGKLRNLIMNSNDSATVRRYREWIDKKQLLTKALAYSPQQLQEAGIDLRKLQKEIDDLDKNLSRRSKLFIEARQLQIRRWQEVAAQLRAGEAAVEIIRYPYYDKGFTDSVVYAALILPYGEKNAPKFIPIANGNALEDTYLKVYRNSVKFGLTDRLSYKRYWEPVDKALADAKKVYLSVEGAYNQVNVEALLVADDTYVIDRREIVLLTNTTDLLEQNRQATASANSFVFFGNPVFYKDLQPEEYLGTRNRKIPQLPGAFNEVKNLTQLIGKSNPSTSEFVLTEATEEHVKQLQSPRVFHIATHGFFEPDLAINLSDNELSSRQTVNNPLLRSGLLLRNGGDLVATENVYAYNKEEGILTAYEAMDLALENTELVVLSACETGRGDTRIGEGVYGLQRAFRVAGAKSLIMSLFKVDDAATQRLMELFYSRWLQNGNKREAFTYAKKELRKEYPSPKFWGAFIMVGAD